MYKKITNIDDELLFTHAHQRELEKPNPVILDSIARAELYIANTFIHLKHEAIHALMLSTRSVLLESRPILTGKFSLKELTTNLLISHIIQANATRLILIHHNPRGSLSIKDKHLLEATRIKDRLLEYSIWLDDFFLITKADTANNSGYNRMNTTSLARLGLV